jgi:methanogenic corrinoid protein MtbC1
MGREMNAPDKRALLVRNMVDLEETAVLDLVEERLAAGGDPLQILEDAQEGMHLVGVQYEEGKYYVAGLMMAGEIFREIMERVEPVLVQRLSGTVAGNILLGTMQGDIHDIGKNIFITLLRCHGFTVTDLGIDIPPQRFKEAAFQILPDIIGLYGLLTTSFEVMKATVRLIRQAGDPQVARTPVIIGGGLVNPMVCAYVGADYWATDAMVGIHLCTQILAKKKEIGPS